MKKEELAKVLTAIHGALAGINDRLQNVEVALDKDWGMISEELDVIESAVTTLEAQYYDEE